MAVKKGSYEIENFKWLVRTVFRDIHKKQARKVWILGAGASVDSKIEPASIFAHRWSCEMLGLDPEKTSWEDNLARWGEDAYLSELYQKGDPKSPDFLAQQYFAVYARRFKQNANAGYTDLRKSMEGRTPSVGYLVLAQLISDGANLVITVNFDNLIADALFLMGKGLPLIVDHEDVAHLANPREDVALICKIHRDLLKAPLNTDEEMTKLSEKWRLPLNEIFKNHAPIFIGYGGNDKTLMGYLTARKEGFREAPLWLHYTKLDFSDVKGIRKEVSPAVTEFLEATGGILVPHTGFDDLMFFAQRDLELSDIVAEFDTKTSKVRKGLELRINTLIQRTSGEAKDNAVAQATVEEARASKPRTVSQWHLKAASERDLSKRAAIYAESVKEHNNPYLFNYFAHTMVDLGRYEEALVALDRVVSLGGEDSGVYNLMSLSHSMLREPNEALAASDYAVSMNPSAESLGYQALALNTLGRFTEALSAADRAIDLDPDESLGYLQRSYTLALLERYQESLLAAEEGIELNPQSPFGYRSKGEALIGLERYSEAKQQLKRAIRIAPRDARSRWSAPRKVGH